MTTAAASEPDRKSYSPAYRQNPQPRQAYRITMTIADAPGPFAYMLGLAQFDVVNKECLPPPDENNGHTWPVPTEGVKIPLQKVSDTEYVGTVYADQMLDEDYFGRGICRWQLIQAQVQLKATGADGETLFIPSISDEKLLAGQAEKVYFNKISYPRLESSSLDEPQSSGQTDRSRFGPSIRDAELFTVTFTPSKDASP